MAATLRGSVLEASDKAASDRFAALAFSADGEVLAVGADGRDSGGTDRGGVYIYDRNGSGWTARGSVLTAADAADSDFFGIAVAFSADALVMAVGAYAWEGAAGTDRGGVYVYDKNGSGWTQRCSVLEAADAADSDNFGRAVALSADGTVLIVGANLWEGATGADRGGVYIYDKNGTGWTQRGSVLEAADAADSDNYAISVSLSADGQVLSVGASGWEGATGSNRGGVYVYDKNGSGWTQRGSVLEAADAADGDNFGRGLSLPGNAFVLAVGAFNWEGAAGTDRGGVYIYDKNGSGWTARGAVIEAADAADTDRFGFSVKLANGALIMGVGAQLWESGATADTGGVYIYDWDFTSLAGTAAAVATATGALDIGTPVAGTAAGIAAAAGALTTAIQLAGAAGAIVSAQGALQADNALAGAVVGLADASGNLLTVIQMNAAAIAAALATGNLSTGIALSASAQALATAAANLTTQLRFNGQAVAQAMAAAGLDTSILLQATAQAQVSAVADLTTYRPIFGDAVAQTQAIGVLTEPEPPALTFILGGLSVPFQSHLDLNQDYEEEQSSRVTRHSDGSARKQTAWRGKLRMRISGNGWVPPGLDTLDYESSMEMSCIALRAVTSTERVITIPAARRSDQGFEPFAAATVDGGKIDAAISNRIGNVYTIAAVSGAQFYHMYYYPKLQVFASLPIQRHDAINDKYSWELEAREV